jgi:GNAT superfamily N-acetyltransferase
MSLGEADAATRLVHTAFAHDPIMRWVWPDEGRWASVGRAFLDRLAEVRLSGGEAWVTDDLSAVALWEPPGGIYASRPGLWPEFNRLLMPDEEARLSDYDAAIDQRRPADAHWYLGVLAVAADRRGSGLARVVATPILDSADRTTTSVVLETATPVNLAIYARLGFEVDAEVDLPHDGPHVWLLRRPAG